MIVNDLSCNTQLLGDLDLCHSRGFTDLLEDISLDLGEVDTGCMCIVLEIESAIHSVLN